MKRHFLFQLIVAALLFCNTKVWADNAVPFVIDSQDKWTTYYTGTSSNATMSWSNSFVMMARQSESWNSDRYFDIAFTGEPSKISFSYKNDEGSRYGGNIIMKIQESVDGSSWSVVVENVKPSNLSAFKAFGPYNLKTTTRRIRITMRGVDAEHDFQNITVTAYDPVPAFNIASSEDWGNVSVGKSVAKAITATDLNDAAKDGTWTASISGTDASMFVLSSATPALGACNVTYTPSAAGSHSAVLTLRATNKTDTTKYVEKTVNLSGVGDATAVIELTKQGESSPSTNHDFGSVIGTNAATPLVLNVFSASLAEGPVVEWKTTNDAFQYTQSGNAITISAQPATAVASQDVKNAVLTVKGKSAVSETYDVVKEFSVTLTANPRVVPTKQWNIGTQLFERNEYSDFFTTNSDGAVSVTFSQGNQYLSFANGKLVTAAIPSSPQAVGSITVHYPATATYDAIEETLSDIILVTNPAYLPVTINSEAIYNLLYAGQSNADNKNKANAQWSSSESAIQLINIETNTKRYVDFAIKGTPYQLTFQYKNDEGTSSQYKGNIVIKIYEDKGTGNPNSEVLNTKPSSVPDYISFGPYELNAATRKIRIEQSGIYANAWFKDFSIIASEPTLNVTETSVDLKANNTQVYDNSIHFSVLKYSTIKAKIEGADFGLIKGDAVAASEITFTSADGLNDATFTDCTFKVCYSGGLVGAIGKTASVKFYDGDDNQLGSAVAVSIVAVPVLTFEAPANGSYTYKYGSEDAVIVNETKTRDLATAPYEVTLTATPASGYKFFAWYEKNGDTKTYLSTATPYTPIISTTKTIGAEFISNTTPVFMVKGQEGAYLNLNDACSAVASSSSKIVVLADDGTLAAGNYTIPAGVTLLIPYESTNDCRKENANVAGNQDYVTQSPFRTLSMASNANITVNGNIEVGGKLCNDYNQGSKSDFPGNCCLTGTYGRIIMDAGSHITLNNGANLYAWGLIIRKDNSIGGTITAGNGSTVYEPFQITDFSGGSALDNWYNRQSSTKNFMYTQYYVQNVEVPLTFEFGAKEKVQMAIYPSSEGKTQINYIGKDNQAMFQLYSGGTITKSYSPAKDRQVYEVNGSTAINDLVISVSGYSMSTSKYRLPLTNNMSITISSGTTTVNANMVMLADAEATIAEGAELIIAADKSVWLYDKDQWGKTYDYVTNYIAPLQYAWPNAKYRTYATMEDARLCVNGKLTVNGYLFTTESGANINSTQTGSIEINKAPLTSTSDYTLHPMTANGGRGKTNTYADIVVTAAQLRNSDGSYTQTAKCLENTTFGYKDGNWLAYVPAPVDPTKDTTIVVEEGEEIVIKDESQTEHIDTIKVADGGNVVIEADITTPVIVEQGGTLNVEEDVEVETIALTTTPAVLTDEQAGNSSQVTGGGVDNLKAANIYIDINMNASGSMDKSRYYAFAVPFPVNVTGGVQKISSNGQASAAVSGTDFLAYTYNGSARASKGKKDEVWEEVPANGKFTPGTFYLIAFGSNSYNTYRFTKANGQEDKINNAGDIDLIAYSESGTADTDKGWNGIANNALKNASFTATGAGATKAQVLNSEGNAFTPVTLATTSFAIGTPMFVQATQDGTAQIGTSASAPARMLAANESKQSDEYTIRIKAEGETKMADQLFISASEDASNQYVVGKDLVKMFMGNATIAQLWVNDYDKKLSVNQAVLTNDIAVASLTLYAPKAGNYQVYLKDIPEDATLYLLKNGQAVANLNEGTATVSLTKGENTQYGLRIYAIKTIPGVVTSIDEALVGGDLQKVLLDGVVYIVRDGKLFTVLGQER